MLIPVKTSPIFRFCASVVCSPKTGKITICVMNATPYQTITLGPVPRAMSARAFATASSAGATLAVSRLVSELCGNLGDGVI